MYNILLGSILTLMSLTAFPGIPYPFFASQGGGANKVMVVEDGISALTLRVQMIRRAKSHIEAEYFIFNVDTAGRIIAHELIAAAKKGVKVRVLVDSSFTVLELKANYAKALAELGIQVRYYNRA